MDDLGQLILVVLFILFGLISSSKKKARQNRSRVAATSPAEAVPPQLPETPGQVEEMVQPKSALAQELLALLQGEAVAAGEPVVTLPDVDDEAQSVETLEPAGEESHKRFHERYVDEAPTDGTSSLPEVPKPRSCAVKITASERAHETDETTAERAYEILARSRRKKHLSRHALRHAFVMKEVLGPPKALEE